MDRTFCQLYRLTDCLHKVQIFTNLMNGPMSSVGRYQNFTFDIPYYKFKTVFSVFHNSTVAQITAGIFNSVRYEVTTGFTLKGYRN